MVGFGPTVWSRRRGETEYGLKAIPLGGYIRMIGMFPPKPGADPSMLRGSSTGRFSQLMDQAREDSMEEVKRGDEDRVFYKLSTPRKLVVMLGGPTMNLVIAVFLLTGIFTLNGIGQLTTRVSRVSECVQTVPAGGAAPAACSPSDPKAPANVAGILPGDRVISLAGQPVNNWDDVRALIRPNGGRPIDVVVERDGQTLDDGDADPHRRAADRRRGQSRSRPRWQGPHRSRGFHGLLAQHGDRQTASRCRPGTHRRPDRPHGRRGAQDPGEDGRHRPGRLRRRERDPNGPMSVVGVGRVAGEVADGQLAAWPSLGLSYKFVVLLSLIASLNLALWVFNLIPLLPLDGGHAVGALWEGFRHRWPGCGAGPTRAMSTSPRHCR